MNRMEQVAQLLGVDIGEEFNIRGDACNPYCIKNEGLFDKEGTLDHENLTYLINGSLEIEKIPFKPKQHEWYWTVFFYRGLTSTKKYAWISYDNDYLRYKNGLVFRTEEEAKKIGIPRFKEIIKEYEI